MNKAEAVFVQFYYSCWMRELHIVDVIRATHLTQSTVFKSKRSWPSRIYEAFFLTLPVKMVVLCLKVSSAGYYWCQSCNTLQQEADHTVKSFGKQAQLRYYLWALAPCMKFCCVLFWYSGWSAYYSIHLHILLNREAAMPAAGVVVCVGYFMFVCLPFFLNTVSSRTRQRRLDNYGDQNRSPSLGRKTDK